MRTETREWRVLECYLVAIGNNKRWMKHSESDKHNGSIKQETKILKPWWLLSGNVNEKLLLLG